jgi:hypothetical protein
MYIICEAATCILLALIATALPFTVFAICLLLKSGAEYLSGTLQKLTQDCGSAIADDFSKRILGKSLVQEQFPSVYRAVGRKEGWRHPQDAPWRELS